MELRGAARRVGAFQPSVLQAVPQAAGQGQQLPALLWWEDTAVTALRLWVRMQDSYVLKKLEDVAKTYAELQVCAQVAGHPR